MTNPVPRKNSRKSADAAESARHMLARAELIVEIQQAISEKGWTQVEAAKVLGVAQPRISDLMNGHAEKFTVDMLMIWLEKLGKDVRVSVRTLLGHTQPVSLVLYVAGNAHIALRENICKLFDHNLAKYSLKVVDVIDDPESARLANVTSTPCLIREAPVPRIALVGNISPAHVRWCLP